MEEGNLQFIDVPWVDVLFPRIMSQLTVKDLAALRSASDDFCELVTHYVQQLKILDLGQEENATFTSDEIDGFKNILQNCRSLEHLILRNCTFLEDDMIKPLFPLNRDLVCFNVANCTRLTSSILQPLAVNCKQIQVLVLRGLTIAPGAMESLTYHLKQVIHLDLASCPDVTETVLIHIAESWPQLRNVNLSFNPQVTDNCLENFATNCPYLEYLTVKRCERVTTDVSSVIRQHAVNLKELTLEPISVPIQDGRQRFLGYR